jgi:hypothetical protein
MAEFTQPAEAATARREYTVLLCMRGPTPGEVSAVQLGDGEWGRKEGPPVFRRVKITATEAEIAWLQMNGQYDPQSRTFKHKETGEAFDSDYDIVADEDFDQNLFRCRQLAIELNGGVKPVGTACDFLRAKHIPRDEDDRRHFMRLFWPHRRLPGVMALLKAAKRGLYPDLQAALRAIDRDTVRTILGSWGAQDREYFLWMRNTGAADVDYTTPQAWYDAHKGDITGDSNAPYIGELAAETFPGLTMSESTTSAARYFHLRAQAGAEFDGDFAGSYPVLNTIAGTTGIIEFNDSYVRLEHFVVGKTGALIGPNFDGVDILSGAMGFLLDTVGAFQVSTAREDTAARAFGFTGTGCSGVVRNCAVGDLAVENTKEDQSALCGAMRFLVGSTVSIFNCAVHGLTAIGNGAGDGTTLGLLADASTTELINNVIGAITGDVTAGVSVTNPVSSDLQYNATTDTSGGTNSQDNITPASEFEDTTLATLDLHMKAGGQCEDNGLDLITAGYSNAPTEDCDDETRPNPGTWSIGIDHQGAIPLPLINGGLINAGLIGGGLIQ